MWIRNSLTAGMASPLQFIVLGGGSVARYCRESRLWDAHSTRQGLSSSMGANLLLNLVIALVELGARAVALAIARRMLIADRARCELDLCARGRQNRRHAAVASTAAAPPTLI